MMEKTKKGTGHSAGQGPEVGGRTGAAQDAAADLQCSRRRERIRDMATGRQQTDAFRFYFPEKGPFSLFSQKKYLAQ